MIGKMISHYKIIEKLGEGGMGVVYKAEDTKLKRTVALKFLPLHLTTDETDKKRFLHEAQSASAINHPNVCVIHDIQEHDDQQFIVMEYVDGVTLRQKVQERQLELNEVIDYALQIAEALKAAHEEGIIHRDIKSENIMVTAKNQIKVMDFGLAKLKGSAKLTQKTSTLGTVAYMSPEQIQGQEIDARSDIFSFGVVLYELMTSHLPFQGEYEAALSYAILNNQPVPVRSIRPEVSPALEKIIDRCLEKDRIKRYQQADEIISDLHKASLGTTTRESKQKKSYKTTWIVGPVFFLVLLLIGLYFLLTPQIKVSSSSIAVLPFQNLSAEGPYAYFAGGLHDELLTQLSKVAALKVISRTSVMGYAGTPKSLKQIASELGVGSVVEGSVQVAGERLRVNVQLIEASTDAHLWAER